MKEFWLQRGIPENDMQNASYFEHLLSWLVTCVAHWLILLRWQHRKDENVLLVHFEDMKSDLRSTVVRVAQFMNVEADDTLVDKVTELSSFDFMRKNNDKFNENLTKAKRNGPCGLPADAGMNSSKVRAGGVGGGHQLSDEIRAAIDEKWKKVAKVTGCATYEDLREATNAAYQAERPWWCAIS